MERLAERITAELRVLVGQPLADCWRVANMQVFEFGPQRQRQNRNGEWVAVSDIALHVQCRWRVVDDRAILFGRDDLNYPADETIELDSFDSDKHQSALDVALREWLAKHRGTPLEVNAVQGDPHGGFRISLVGGVAVECFPCDSRRGENSERWRLLGHRADDSHFVVNGDGVEAESS